MFLRPRRLYKYISFAGAQSLFSSPNPEIWFRLANQLNDVYDLAPVGSYLDTFGAIGSFCLSETAISAPMWSHYGSNGQGVVLEFLLASEFFCANPPQKVRYCRRRPTVKNVRAALTTKSADWAYEKEWRCFISPNVTHEDQPRFLLAEQALAVPFPFAALRSVIHGYDSRVSDENFLSRPEASHVKQMVCRKDAWNYGFNICAMDDMKHIYAHRDSILWGRRQSKT